MRASIGGEFTILEKCRVCKAISHVNVKILSVREVTEEITKYGEGDRLFGLVACFTMVVLNALDEALNN